jgi:hypothetical protein
VLAITCFARSLPSQGFICRTHAILQHRSKNQVFLSKVNGGRAIADYRKDQKKCMLQRRTPYQGTDWPPDCEQALCCVPSMSTRGCSKFEIQHFA